jgi:uncharacterized membrane protein
MGIIITIMVLTIKLPDFNQHDTINGFREKLHGLIPYFITYAFSFLMIGIFWINHHHMFHMLENTDESLLLQNLFFLFWISLIPFATAMIATDFNLSDSAAAYGVNMLMTTLSLSIMRTYTMKKNLVHKGNDRTVARKIRRVTLRATSKSYMGTIAYLCAIPLAYVSVYISYAIYLVPPALFFIPDGIDDERLAEKIEEKE